VSASPSVVSVPWSNPAQFRRTNGFKRVKKQLIGFAADSKWTRVAQFETQRKILLDFWRVWTQRE